MAVKKINSLIIFNSKQRLAFYNNYKKINLSHKITSLRNKIYSSNSIFVKMYKKLIIFFFTNNFYTFFTKINLIGLGFKNFVFKKNLYILIGDCNYLIFSIPNEIKIICKKNQIYGLSENKIVLFTFFSELKKLKKINYYKGKGVLEFNNFKFMKLKVGKKQNK
jgi:ribosomal protein L6P/L9E